MAGFNQNSEGECYNFSKDAKDVAFVIQLSLSSIGLVASAIVIILIFLSKGHRRFIYRLVIYFMTVVFAHAFTHIVNVLPIDRKEELTRVKDGWLPVCKLVGFLDQTVHFANIFSILWIIVYLVSFSWQLYKLQEGRIEDERYHLTTQAAVNNIQSITISSKEITGLFVVFFAPFLLSWIPFLWDMYGFTGLLCWIRLSRHDTCADRTLSITLMLAMYYVPLLIISFLTVITLLIVMVIMCRGSTKMNGAAQGRFKRGMREIMFVLIYPIIFGFFSAIVVGIHIYSTVHRNKTPTFAYTIVYIVGLNTRLLMPPLGFLLHPYSWKNLIFQNKKHEDDDDTNFYIPPEDDDIPHGITVRGSRTQNTDNYDTFLHD